MAVVTEVIKRLGARGIILRLEGTDGLRVIGISKLTDQEREVLKAHKVALLQALRQSAEPVNDRQSETLSRAPRFNEHPGAVATRVKYGLYTPNCNRVTVYPPVPLPQLRRQPVAGALGCPCAARR